MRRPTIALLTLLVAACEQPVPEVVEVVRPIKMLELAAGGLGQTLEYPATIGAAREAEIAFEVGELITELPVRDGQFVREGQLVARLDPRDFEANVDAVRAQRNVALADYRRNQDLYAADAVSQQQLEVSRRQYEVADARIRTVEKALEDTSLTAPFSGRVVRTLVEAFQSIGPRQPVLVLQDAASSLEVILNVPENDVAFRPDVPMAQLRDEMNLEVELTAYAGRRFPARPREFSPEADPVARTFQLTLGFTPPREIRVLPGMTARVPDARRRRRRVPDSGQRDRRGSGRRPVRLDRRPIVDDGRAARRRDRRARR